MSQLKSQSARTPVAQKQGEKKKLTSSSPSLSPPSSIPTPSLNSTTPSTTTLTKSLNVSPFKLSPSPPPPTATGTGTITPFKTSTQGSINKGGKVGWKSVSSVKGVVVRTEKARGKGRNSLTTPKTFLRPISSV